MTEKSKSILIWTSVVAGIVGMVVILAMVGNGGSGTTASLSNDVVESENTKGNPFAPLQLVEYSDFQCPACKQMYPVLKRLAQDLPNDLAVTYRHFPLRSIHPNADLAAQASEAAANQDKFWEMHDVIFNTQSQWSGMDDPTEFFTKLANSIGLDQEKFTTDLNSKEVADRVEADYNEASAMRLPGTPSFFLNGQAIQAPSSYEGFKSLIEQTIAEF